MIQKNPSRRSPSRVRRSPSGTEIARRREEIQTSWSAEERLRRTSVRRLKQPDPQLTAQLRFIEFLIATHSQPAKRRKSSHQDS